MTLDDLLMVAGHLDDESGFDTARERFRRFLVERVTDVGAVRALIDQCQYSGSDQHRRALQDLVALLGRFLGFSTRFASYVARPGERKEDGRWHSAHQLDLTLSVCSDPAHLPAPPGSAAGATNEPEARPLRLHVLTPACEARARLDGILQAPYPDASVRVVTVRSIIALAEMAGTGRLHHEDVVRLWHSGSDIELVVELLERLGSEERRRDHPAAAEGSTHAGAETQFWVATVSGDERTPPEQTIVHAVGERHELEITEAGNVELVPQRGDGICLYIPSVGIVGSCEVRSVGEAVATADDRRFTRKLQLARIVLYADHPRPPGYEIQLRLRVDGRRRPQGHWLAQISRDEFTRVTAAVGHDAHGATAAGASRNGRTVGTVGATAADSPSPA